MEQKFPGEACRGSISDKCAALKSIGFSIGSFTGPIIGGYLYDKGSF